MRNVVIGLYGTILDWTGKRSRWERWRPTLSLCQHEDFLIDRLELLYIPQDEEVLHFLIEDIKAVSPETEVRTHVLSFKDAWDFEEVFGELYRFTKEYRFDEDHEQYFINITTGTHVAQICLFLLTEAHYFSGRLIQASPPARRNSMEPGRYRIIDLDLSKYDLIASRFKQEREDSLEFLKSGIATRNARFNAMIEEIEKVAIRSRNPMLLTGPTGAGKSLLAKRIFELKKVKRQVEGQFVEINCATLRGDAAMSTLFGHVRGSYTGATGDRMGLLKAADKGILFLDEIGELGLDEQAMLLMALEEGRFRPVGSDREVFSQFQLLAGTNRDLWQHVVEGRFREDLLARIDTWSFALPPLKDRKEDLEPNLYYELDRAASARGEQISFNKEALRAYLTFALGPEGEWRGNFRDLNASVTRMTTLADGGRINETVVHGEIGRLQRHWRGGQTSSPLLLRFFSEDELQEIDLFDQAQLAEVLNICGQSRSLSEAGRTLFAASRRRKTSRNDSDRLAKYLAKFGLTPDKVLFHP